MHDEAVGFLFCLLSGTPMLSASNYHVYTLHSRHFVGSELSQHLHSIGRLYYYLCTVWPLLLRKGQDVYKRQFWYPVDEITMLLKLPD